MSSITINGVNIVPGRICFSPKGIKIYDASSFKDIFKIEHLIFFKKDKNKELVFPISDLRVSKKEDHLKEVFEILEKFDMEKYIPCFEDHWVAVLGLNNTFKVKSRTRTLFLIDKKLLNFV